MVVSGSDLEVCSDKLSKRLALRNLKKKLIGEIQIKMNCTEPSHLGLYSTVFLYHFF